MKINIAEIEQVFDDNLYLMEIGKPYFDNSDDLGDWYIGSYAKYVE